MDTCTPPVESVPERRTKSWKREHEETCTRRYQGQKAGVCSVRPSNESSNSIFLKQKSCNSSCEKDVSCIKFAKQSVRSDIKERYIRLGAQVISDDVTVASSVAKEMSSSHVHSEDNLNYYFKNMKLGKHSVHMVDDLEKELSRRDKSAKGSDVTDVVDNLDNSEELNIIQYCCADSTSERDNTYKSEKSDVSSLDKRFDFSHELSKEKLKKLDSMPDILENAIVDETCNIVNQFVKCSSSNSENPRYCETGNSTLTGESRIIEECHFGDVNSPEKSEGSITRSPISFPECEEDSDCPISLSSTDFKSVNLSDSGDGSTLLDNATVPGTPSEGDSNNVCNQAVCGSQIDIVLELKANHFQNNKINPSKKKQIDIGCEKHITSLENDSSSDIYQSNEAEEDCSTSEYCQILAQNELNSSMVYYNKICSEAGKLSSNNEITTDEDCQANVSNWASTNVPVFEERTEIQKIKEDTYISSLKDESGRVWVDTTCRSAPITNDENSGSCALRKEPNSDSILGSLGSCLIAGGFVNISCIPSASFSTEITGYTVGPDGLIQVITVPPNRRMKLENKIPSDVGEEDKVHLMSYVFEAGQRIAIKDELRTINHNVSGRRPDDRHFTKLDSSLKKNTAFVRKLKTFTGSQLDTLVKDLASLNLTKYVSEVAAALVEAKLKMVDVWPAVQLCNILHQTYSEFSTYLLDNWHKVLTIKRDEKIANQAKLRVDLRFYAELISVGIFTHKEGLPLLGNVLTMLTNSDKEDHHNINIILSFCRHCGDDYAGLIPRKLREVSEKYSVTIPRYKLLPKEKQRNVKALLKEYFTSLCRHLRKEHLELQAFIRQNRKILQTKGELSSERKERLEALQASFDRIANGAQQFAEALDEDVPQLPEDESLKNETLIMNGSSESEEGTSTGMLWEDEETRRFYECFPDMKEFMPSLQVRVADPEPQISEETLDAEFEGELVGDPPPDDDITPSELEEVEEPEPVGNASNKILLEAFLIALPNCINREMIDSAAVDFVMTLNSKHNRRKLVKTLFGVPRIRLDLLPFYARLVATLHPVMPDVAADLAQMLKQDFKYHVRKKDQMNIESKIKIVRFIGELVKFRMYSKIEGLYCLKILVQDFTHHHIEMCCNLLESCGRFFFRHPDCYQRMKVYLDQMMRKRAVMALDSRYVTMIENAYYYVNPPELTQCVVKERPEEHQFIRKILYQHLMKSNTDKVLRLMRKLDWSNPEVNSYAVKCLTYAFKVKYFNIRCMASLLAGLATQQEFVGTQVVDGVLEDIRLGMEMNLPKYNQRRVAMIKYLGELYNYRMVESSNIFQVLYSLITFAVTWDHGIPSPLDTPDNLFRIRLVCVLLETCGQYFISGVSKKKLDTYLVYFQHYFWFKFSDPCWSTDTPFPFGMNYMFKDTITSLRPNISLFESFEEATEAVGKLRIEESVSNVAVSFSETNALSEDGSVGDDSFTEEGEMEHSNEDESALLLTESSTSTELNDSKEIRGNDIVDYEEEEEEEVEEEDQIHDNGEEEEEEEEEEEDFNETPSEIDDTDIDWGNNSDVASHMSEGDSQNEELILSGEKSGLLHGPTLVECPEDDDFLNAFDRMVSDNIQDRMRESVKPQQVDISVPLHIKGSAKKTYEQLREEESTKSIVNFVLMLRKGHKQQYKNLAVPVNSEMALNLKNREEAERAEKECVKRLTLDINERLEEEDYQEMLAQTQRPVVMNLNRERRHKYQHPKGAPDADLIFGPKKVSTNT